MDFCPEVVGQGGFGRHVVEIAEEDDARCGVGGEDGVAEVACALGDVLAKRNGAFRTAIFRGPVVYKDMEDGVAAEGLHLGVEDVSRVEIERVG